MKWFSRLKLRNKLLLMFCSIVSINLLVSVLYAARVNEMLAFNQVAQNTYTKARRISDEVEEANYLITQYNENPSNTLLTQYFVVQTSAWADVASLENYSGTNDETFAIRAITNSLETQFGYYALALSHRDKNPQDFYEPYYAGQKIMKYLPGYINDYMNILIKTNVTKMQKLEAETLRADTLSKQFLVVSTILCLLYAISISNRITVPILALSNAAIRISKGEHNLPDLPIINEDEIGELTKTFNVMKDDIHIAIETIIQRAALENRLYTEEVKNLKTAELLHEAQYLALQSQISPHFLFNTLNAISRAISSEPKEIAVQLVCNLADLFRYNLDHLNTFSTIHEELEVVGKYIYIQKHRFEERVTYEVTCPDTLKNALVPSMLVQPLVENSLIHGIENLEHGGKIVVHVSARNGNLRFRVYDNGMGIPAHTLAQLRDKIANSTLSTAPKSETDDQPLPTESTFSVHRGHTTGIGIVNISQRLHLLSGSAMRIQSNTRHGTLIELTFPIVYEQEGTHV